MNCSFSRIIGLSFSTAIKNIPSLFAATILWLVTLWIPFINVGTTIALFYGMPIELSKGKVMNPLKIFKRKYRKFMGEFFSIIGLMTIALIPALCFMVIPAIVIYIGWKFAVMLLIDHQLNPSEAMTMSTKYTYGYKWRIFWSTIFIGILTSIICGGIAVAIVAIDSDVALILLSVLGFGLMSTIGVATESTFYRIFVSERKLKNNNYRAPQEEVVNNGPDENIILEEMRDAYQHGDYTRTFSFASQIPENSNAQCMIAFLYCEGLGVPQDYSKAFNWYMKAAVNGNINAMHNMGEIYEYGIGVPQDYTAALKWYKRAAESGYRPAMEKVNKLQNKNF